MSSPLRPDHRPGSRVRGWAGRTGVILIATCTIAACGSDSGSSAATDAATTSPSPSTTTPAPTTLPAPIACPDMQSVNERGDSVTEVMATGVPCDEAAQLVLAVTATHSPWSDAPTLTSGAYGCGFEQLPVPAGEAGARGRYTCVAEFGEVQWVFNAGE